MAKIRTTMHNGRAGKRGVYSAKHNSRNFDVENVAHIDAERVSQNQYILVSPTGEMRFKPKADFDKHEQKFYTAMFGAALETQNEKYRKKDNYDRVKTIDDYRTSKQTCPEEVILQIGDRNSGVQADKLINAFAQWYNNMVALYGTNWHCMDACLHMDEKVPHIHCRFCWSHETPTGRAVSQTKALAALGIERPDMTTPKSQHNNAKMTWTKSQREIWETAVRAQGIELEDAPAEPGKRTVELEDYVREQIRAEVHTLTEQKEQLQQETAQLAVEREQLHTEVCMLREEKTSLQRITDRLKASCMRLFEKLAHLVCADGRVALEHVKHEAQDVLDVVDGIERDEYEYGLS